VRDGYELRMKFHANSIVCLFGVEEEVLIHIRKYLANEVEANILDVASIH
jgi:hypothetical protein